MATPPPPRKVIESEMTAYDITNSQAQYTGEDIIIELEKENKEKIKIVAIRKGDTYQLKTYGLNINKSRGCLNAFWWEVYQIALSRVHEQGYKVNGYQIGTALVERIFTYSAQYLNRVAHFAIVNELVTAQSARVEVKESLAGMAARAWLQSKPTTKDIVQLSLLDYATVALFLTPCMFKPTARYVLCTDELDINNPKVYRATLRPKFNPPFDPVAYAKNCEVTIKKSETPPPALSPIVPVFHAVHVNPEHVIDLDAEEEVLAASTPPTQPSNPRSRSVSPCPAIDRDPASLTTMLQHLSRQKEAINEEIVMGVSPKKRKIEETGELNNIQPFKVY